MKRKLNILILALLTLSLTARAEILTLDSCLEQARQHNCTIKSALLDVAISREVKKQVLWKYFPLVSINAMGFGAAKPLISFDVTSVGGGSDLGNMLKDVLDAIESLTGKPISSEINLMRWGVSAQAQLVQPLYWGGQIVTGNKLAKLGIDASQLKGEVSERDVLQEVTEHYWLVAGLMDKRRTLMNAIELLDTVDMVANTAYVHGLVTKNDLLKVQLKRNEIDTKRLQLENGIHLASRMLCHLIGRDHTGELELEPFPETETIDVLAEMPDTFYIDGRPEAKLLELNVKYNKLMKRMAVGEALPHLFLGIQGGYTNFFERHRVNGLAFVSMSIPLTQWGETSHKIKEHNLRIRQAELMRDDLKGKLRLQNEQVYDQLSEAIKLIEQHHAAKLLAEDNYDTSLMNYRAGMSTMTELLEAETLLLQANNAYTDARINYRTTLRKYNDYNR